MRLFWVILFLARAACADVLFVDLNNVSGEIKAAQEVATKRGEKLIVIPTDREKYVALSKEITRIQQSISANNALIEKSGCLSAPTPSPDCSAAYKKTEGLSEELQRAKAQKYTSVDFKKDLENVSATATSVIVSGHDGNANFYGDFGEISARQFLSSFQKYGGQKNIKSIYLLGCNASVDNAYPGFLHSFPSVAFIAGYEETGYLRENPAGHQFIRNLMSEEENILKSKTTEEALAKFKLYSPKSAKYGTAACLIPKDQTEPLYISTTNPSGPLKKVLGCGNAVPDAKTLDYIRCVKAGESGCSLDKAQYLSVTSKPECEFLQAPDGSVAGAKSDMYLIQSLNDPDSDWNIEKIMAHASPAVRAQFRLDEKITSFPELKEKLLRLREYYHAQVPRAPQSEFFDKAWLAVSNFDLNLYYQLRNSP